MWKVIGKSFQNGAQLEATKQLAMCTDSRSEAFETAQLRACGLPSEISRWKIWVLFRWKRGRVMWPAYRRDVTPGLLLISAHLRAQHNSLNCTPEIPNLPYFESSNLQRCFVKRCPVTLPCELHLAASSGYILWGSASARSWRHILFQQNVFRKITSTKCSW